MSEAGTETIIAEPKFPQNGWQFNEEVTEQFDQMLARSIPQYELMRQSCFEIGSSFVERKTDVVDLGCSRGEAIAPFVEKFGAQNYFTLCEVSKPMLQATRLRYQGWIESGLMQVKDLDLRAKYPLLLSSKASLTLCVLTLQFTPIEYRQQILQRIYDSTIEGGALILVEKVLGRTASLDNLFVNLYLSHKKANGYTQEEIDRKRFALEGVLVPQTAKTNEEMLSDAGFRKVDCFWRWLNFAGWIAVK